jgi:hypothetical protein
MASEYRTALPPISHASMQSINVTQQAFMEEVIINNLIVENTIITNLDVEQTLTYNILTNGEVTISGNTITGLAAPTEPNDAATLSTVASGTWKNSTIVATTIQIVLTGLQTIDGISLLDGDRVLVKNQTLSSENGFYNAKPGSWVRAEDGLIEYQASSSSVIVSEGTTNGNKLFFCITDNANFGDPITFAEISGGGGGSVIAGAALSFAGTVLNVNVDGTTILVNGSNQLELTNDDLTIGVGSGISGGGLVALGGTSADLTVDGSVIRTTGGQTIGGTGLSITGTNGVTTDTLTATLTSSTISMFDNTETGTVNIATSATGLINIGGSTSTTTINGVTVANTVAGSVVGSNVSLFDNTTTGQIDVGTSSTGTFNFGGASSTVTVAGNIVVPSPSGNTSVVNRGFVNSKSNKDSVRYASTLDITLTGITGATTVDGSIPGIGNRVLLKNQTPSTENGIYVWTQTTLTDTDRALDALIGMRASGSSTIVEEGTSNGDKFFFCNSDNGAEFGDALSYTEISGSGGVTAGDALLLTGSVLDVLVDGTTISIDGGTNKLKLTNDDLTIGVGSGISGGGLVALGGTSADLAVDGTVIRTTGGQTIGGTGLAITGTNGATTDTLTATSTSSTISLFDNTVTGSITVAGASTSTLTLGTVTTTVLIPGTFTLDNIAGSTSGTSVTIYDTTTTGTVSIANNVTTGAIYMGSDADNIYLGGASSNVFTTGTIFSDELKGSLPTSTINLYGDTTSGTVNMATSATGTVNIGGSTSTTTINGVTVADTIDGSATGSNVSLFNNTTTGQIDVGTTSSGTFNFGGASSTVTIAGDMVVPSPSGNTSVVNRGFVNSKSNKDSARYASALDIDLTSITGATLVDGFVPAIGDRVLLKNQTPSTENGIYVWTQTTMTDADRSLDALIGMRASGSSMIVEEGTANGDRFFFCGANNGVNFGASISFTEISGGGGAGAPSAPNESIQFNNSNSFGGSANLIWSDLSTSFSITGQQKILSPAITKFTGTPSSAGSTFEVQSQRFTHTGTNPTTTPLGVFNSFAQPTYTATNPGITFSEAATVYIENAPATSSGGGNEPSIVNGYSLLTGGGMVGIQDSTASDSTTTGALIVTGGIGCGNDIRASGNVYAHAIISTSDATLKENIIPLTNSLEQIMKIKTYEYNMIGQKQKQYGVLAQQLEEAGLNHMVSKESEHMYVNYMQLIPMLISSVKQLSDELNQMKNSSI